MCLIHTKKVYTEGDFSFIIGKELRKTLSYDYIHCFSDIKRTDTLSEMYFEDSPRRSDEIDRDTPPNVWDTPPGLLWKRIARSAYPYHNERTYKYNMKLLYCIRTEGWNTFVKKYKNHEF
jgi:hypothetical protein